MSIDLIARAMAANASGGGEYVLPIATQETLGGVKVGNNVSVDNNGILSAQDTIYTAGANVAISSANVISASFTQANTDWNATSGAAQILNKPFDVTSTVYTNVCEFDEIEGGLIPHISAQVLSEANLLTVGNTYYVSLDGATPIAIVCETRMCAELGQVPSLAYGDINERTGAPESMNSFNIGSHESLPYTAILAYDNEFSTVTVKEATTTVSKLPLSKVDITAGQNISITDGSISAVDTKYTAGTGINIVGNSIRVKPSDISYNDISNKPDLSNLTTKTYVDTADAAIQGDVDAIEALIPAQATSSNQLADKNFVNSSIQTATATFRGTYNTLEELEAVTADENDYGFVISTDTSGNTLYNRYKYTNNAWAFEYALNNSSFTAAQWSAINSGITSAAVGDITSNTAARHTHSNASFLNGLSQSTLDAKQNTLTAGTNITIENNVISAAGGSELFAIDYYSMPTWSSLVNAHDNGKYIFLYFGSTYGMLMPLTFITGSGDYKKFIFNSISSNAEKVVHYALTKGSNDTITVYESLETPMASKSYVTSVVSAKQNQATASTTDLVDGTSSLTTGALYFVYEE